MHASSIFVNYTTDRAFILLLLLLLLLLSVTRRLLDSCLAAAGGVQLSAVSEADTEAPGFADAAGEYWNGLCPLLLQHFKVRVVWCQFIRSV
jgi:hypothetical protein